uniref:Uncharacterized protein n=1 Tax=Romanomermis culicivorax TaxID=13658 RepID=A0A915JPM8_ROMCU
MWHLTPAAPMRTKTVFSTPFDISSIKRSPCFLYKNTDGIKTSTDPSPDIANDGEVALKSVSGAIRAGIDDL